MRRGKLNWLFIIGPSVVISTIKQPLNSSVTVHARHIIIVIVVYTYAIAFLIDTQRFQCPIGSPL